MRYENQPTLCIDIIHFVYLIRVCFELQSVFPQGGIYNILDLFTRESLYGKFGVPHHVAVQTFSTTGGFAEPRTIRQITLVSSDDCAISADQGLQVEGLRGVFARHVARRFSRKPPHQSRRYLLTPRLSISFDPSRLSKVIRLILSEYSGSPVNHPHPSTTHPVI
jgi:hypothetical protein